MGSALSVREELARGLEEGAGLLGGTGRLGAWAFGEEEGLGPDLTVCQDSRVAE